MKLEKIIVRIGGQLKFPFNVEAGNVVRIYRAPYAGFGKNGEWVPVTKAAEYRQSRSIHIPSNRQNLHRSQIVWDLIRRDSIALRSTERFDQWVKPGLLLLRIR